MTSWLLPGNKKQNMQLRPRIKALDSDRKTWLRLNFIHAMMLVETQNSNLRSQIQLILIILSDKTICL